MLWFVCGKKSTTLQGRNESCPCIFAEDAVKSNWTLHFFKDVTGQKICREQSIETTPWRKDLSISVLEVVVVPAV